jgi:hypothetical protein
LTSRAPRRAANRNAGKSAAVATWSVMDLGWGISCVLEIIGAFAGRESCEDFAERGGHGFNAACGGFAQQVLELGEKLSFSACTKLHTVR